MAKRKSRASILEEVLINSVSSGWEVVDINNKFSFEGNDYIIGDSVKQYLVLNKPNRLKDGSFNTWTNDASMTRIFVVDTGEEIRFFDEILCEVPSAQVKLV